MIDPSDIDAQIEERVKTIRKATGGVYTGNVPDGADVPTDAAGTVKPYIVLIFGGQIPSENRRNRGITGVRANLKYHSFLIMAVGSTDKQSRAIAKEVRDLLEGWEPVGGGEIGEESSGNPIYPANSTLKPTRYQTLMTFSLLINT